MSERARTASAAGKVGGAIAISRLLGLVREQVFAAYFGAGMMMDAWTVAFRVPNLLRDLFAEGALSSAFVPTFSKSLEKGGKAKAWHLTNLVMTLMLILLGAFGLLLLIFPEAPVPLLAKGFEAVPGKVALTANMVRILSPFLLCVALAAVTMGILNAFHYYFVPALAPASFNVLVIGSCLVGVPVLARFGIPVIYAAAIGATLGGLFQFLFQVPKLLSLGFRPRLCLDFSHPGLRKIGRLLGPAVVGISALQLNIMINTHIASLLGDGPVSWLNFAFRITYLPIGLFAVAVGTVNLREVSFHAARHDLEALRQTVGDSIRLVGVLVTPSLVGIILLARPIVQTLFEHGRFTPEDTTRTAGALSAYAFALLGYSLVKVLVPTFYALNDTRTPVRISLLSIVVNLSVGVTAVFFLLPEAWRFVGLPIATSVSVGFNSAILVQRLAPRVGGFRGLGIGRTLARSGAAACGMAPLIWVVATVTEPFTQTFLGQGAQLAASLSVGIGSYWLFCRWLGVDELDLIVRSVSEKVRRA